MNRYIPICILQLLFFISNAQNNPVKFITQEGKQPQGFVDEQGVIHVVYGAKKHIYYTKSVSYESFSAPIKVAELSKGLNLGMGRGPQITIIDKEIIVSAVEKDGNIFSWRSKDGKNWQGPVKINDQDSVAAEGFLAIASNNNTVCAIWSDLRYKNNQLFGAFSKDKGKTWSKNLLIYASPDTTICECCKPSLIYDGKHNFYVMWRNQIEENRDLHILSFKDEFKDITPAQRLGDQSWKLNYCPMDGGSLAVGPNEIISSVWVQNKIVFYCEPGKVEEKIGEGKTPVISFNSKGRYILYQSSGQIKAFTPSNETLTLGEGKSPLILKSKNNMIGLWEVGEGIQISLIEDN